jgi:hypothetical protein
MKACARTRRLRRDATDADTRQRFVAAQER